jgi:type I restriction-modification system DNA methylase subunit/restriction endonuclease S subunit
MNANLDKLCFQVKDILRNYGKQQTAEGTMTAEVIMEYLIFIKFFEPYNPKLHGEKRLKVFDKMIEQFPGIKPISSFMEPYIGMKGEQEKKDVIEGEYYLHKLISENEPTSKIFKDTLCLGDRLKHDECTIKILEALWFADFQIDDVGDIHEYFIQDEAKQKSKMYGQFFTPNEICMKAIDIVKPRLREDGNIPDCIDPAAGSFKFMRNVAKRLAETTGKSYDEILFNHCYGCEIETKAYKALQYNILMETGDISDNVYNANSLKYLRYGKLKDDKRHDSLPEYDTDKRYDYIFANPPFGCKAELDMYLKEYIKKEVKVKGQKEEKLVPVHEYPIKTRNSDGMFIQLIIHLLKDGGEACVVLCGSIFNKDMSALRKYWLETCNLKSITVCPKDMFKNTSIETYIFHFVKGEPTKEVIYFNFDGSEIGRRHVSSDNSYDINVVRMEVPSSTHDVTYPKMHLQGICKIESGEYITKAKCAQQGECGYDVYGGGDKGTYQSPTYNRENRMVIAKDGVSLNCVRWVSDKFHLNHHGWTLKCNDAISEEFLYYQLKSLQETIYALADGIAQKGINMENFYKLIIVVPPLEVQNDFIDYLTSLPSLSLRVAATKVFCIGGDYVSVCKKLEALDKNIEITKAKIEADKEYMKILLEVDTAGCEQVRLGDVCKVNQGKFLASDDRQDGEYKIYGGGESSKTHNTHNVEARNMVFPRVGNPMIHWITERFYLTDNGFTLEPKDINIVSKKFVYYHMINAIHADGLYKGSCQKKTTKELVGNIQITLPTLLSQEEIVGKLDNIECMISAANAHIERLQSTKQRVLSYYLNM